MPTPPRPFARFEFLIAWRYLRARRAEGGVSVMTWISFLGIMLAVMALIATLAVRSGFRHEFVGTILGANPHASIIPMALLMTVAVGLVQGMIDPITPKGALSMIVSPLSSL